MKRILFKPTAIIAAVLISVMSLSSCKSKGKDAGSLNDTAQVTAVETVEEQGAGDGTQDITKLRSSIRENIQKADYETAYKQIGEINDYIASNNISADKYDSTVGDLYLKLVVSLLREEALEDACEVGLDYKIHINDSTKWQNSEIYKVLIQACEAQNVDDSPLR